MTIGGLNLRVFAYTPTRGALTRGSAGLDSAPTTVMWLFIQPTCPELNTGSDRYGMATNFCWNEGVSLEIPLRSVGVGVNKGCAAFQQEADI